MTGRLELLAAALSFAVLTLPKPVAADEPRPLTQEKDWVRFGLVLGRVQPLNVCVGKNLQAAREDEMLQWRESYGIDADGGVVAYEVSSPTEHYQAVFRPRGEADIGWVVRDEAGEQRFAATYEQPARGSIKLRVVEGVEEREVRAPHLWSLLATTPPDQWSPLESMLRRIDPRLSLVSRHESLERGLGEAFSEDAARQADLEKRLRGLDSPKFLDRQTAHRELRDLGPPALPWLLQVRQRPNLSAEAMLRLDAIIDAARNRGPDTPLRAAYWLANDPRFLLNQYVQGDAERRAHCRARFAAITGQALPSEHSRDRREQWAAERLPSWR